MLTFWPMNLPFASLFAPEMWPLAPAQNPRISARALTFWPLKADKSPQKAWAGPSGAKGGAKNDPFALEFPGSWAYRKRPSRHLGMREGLARMP